MLKKILIGLVVLVGGFLAFAATRPDSYRVERSTKIDAPAGVVFAQIDEFKAWPAWSPWEKLDPSMKKSFEGPARGVGAAYAWEGNDKVGKGKITITEVQPPTGLEYRLEFMEPFASTATGGFALAPQGDKSVVATWSMEGSNNLMGKIFGIFMNMDAMIGADFEKGLASLKTVAEAEARKLAAAAEAAARAQAEAAAKAQAEAAAAAAAQAAAEAEAAKSKGKGKRKR